MSELIIEIEGVKYVNLEVVVAAHLDGTLGQILEDLDPSKAITFKAPSSEGVQVNPPSIYEFPSDFKPGSIVILRAGGASRRGQVCFVMRNRKSVKAIIWSGREHTLVKDFLANMGDLNAVYDGLSTFSVY